MLSLVAGRLQKDAETCQSFRYCFLHCRYANDAIFLTTALLLGGWVIWYDHAVEGRPEDTWQGW